MTVKVTVLASYAYLRKVPDEFLQEIICDPRVEFLVDSGAFTAFNSGKEVVLSEYIDWLNKWKKYLFGYMALDKLQDPVQTDINLSVMLQEGLTPIPIHVYGDDKPRMDWLFDRSTYVALGGLRRPHRGAAPDEYVKIKMNWAAKRRVHWLGYTSQAMIKAFKPFSVDCANLKSGPMFGQLQLYAGSGNMVSVLAAQWNGGGAVGGMTNRGMRTVVAAAGFDPKVFDHEDGWKDTGDREILNVNMSQWVRYSLDVRQHIGTRLFLAYLSANWKGDHRAMVKAIDIAGRAGMLNRSSRLSTGEQS